MAKKIKRCLYIGLGGTGIKTILQTKKRFIDTYGEVPPMIGFLGIDTDKGEYSKQLLSVRGEVVRLEPHEQLQLHVENPTKFLYCTKLDISWVPECNLNAISMLRDLGAGQLRSNGRFAFTVNKEIVKLVTNCKLADIQNARIVNDDNYELLNSSTTEVHMAFSLCGGTGSGTFLNMAYLLKEIDPNLKIYGCAVLPGVFETLTACARLVPNAYGALLELDYLMRHEMGNKPIELKYIGETYNITSKPFSNIFLIDNINNDYFSCNFNALVKGISTILVTAAINPDFSLTLHLAYLRSNFPYYWASSMGACEIVYKGEALSEIYQMKAAHNIIDRMFNTCADADIIANAWIDSAEVHIRENNGQDHVTDFICSKEPKYPLVISDYRDFIYEVDSNIAINKINSEDIAQKTSELVERVRTELRNLLITNINKEGGVALAKNILEELKIQVGLCLGEMKEEKEYWVAKKPSLKTNLETTVEDLKEYAGKLLATRSGKEQRAADVAEAVRQYNICLTDIQRHDAAINIYNTILVMLGESENRLDAIEKILRAVKSNLSQRIALLQKGVDEDETIFQINLASEDAKRVAVKSEDISINEFISTLSGDWKVYGFTEYYASEIEQMIMAYTKTLPMANLYKNKSIEDIFAQILSKENGETELQNIIYRATHMSMPMLYYNQTPFFDEIIVHTNDFKTYEIIRNTMDTMRQFSMYNNIYFTDNSPRNKITICRRILGIHVQALRYFEDYRQEYENSSTSDVAFHCDAELYARIKSETIK